MKKINFYLLLGLLMSMAVNFTACSKDDEEETTKTVSNADFIGLWELESWSERTIKDGVVVEEEMFKTDGELRCKFDEEGNFIQYEDTNEGWDPVASGAWQYKDGKLYLYNSEEEESTEAIVKSLTATNMVLEWYYTEMTSEGDLIEYYEEETLKKIDE